jgi:hypothetical protein
MALSCGVARRRAVAPIAEGGGDILLEIAIVEVDVMNYVETGVEGR